MATVYDWLKDIFTGEHLGSLSQVQDEALIDALAGIMVADGEIVQEEKEALQRAVERLEWEGAKLPDAYIESAIKRARATQDWSAYAENIAERLGEDWLQDECYYLCAKFAGVDQDLPEPETQYLHSLVDAFDIGRERLTKITAQLREEMDF